MDICISCINNWRIHSYDGLVFFFNLLNHRPPDHLLYELDMNLIWAQKESEEQRREGKKIPIPTIYLYAHNKIEPHIKIVMIKIVKILPRKKNNFYIYIATYLHFFILQHKAMKILTIFIVDFTIIIIIIKNEKFPPDLWTYTNLFTCEISGEGIQMKP